MVELHPREITFTLSIGSYWPEKRYPNQIIFPIGGEMVTKNIEFETDNRAPFKDACDALAREMDKEYHIWYWYWI